MSAFVPAPDDPGYYRGPTSICPHCGKKIDTVTDVQGHGRAPEEGSATICFYCARPSLIEGGHMRVPTESELAELMSEPVVRNAIANIREYWRRQGES